MNEDKKYEVVKFIDKELELDVNVDSQNDTIWLSQNEISKLFNTTKQNISLHINNIFNKVELEQKSVVKFFFTTQA